MSPAEHLHSLSTLSRRLLPKKDVGGTEWRKAFRGEVKLSPIADDYAATLNANCIDSGPKMSTPQPPIQYPHTTPSRSLMHAAESTGKSLRSGRPRGMGRRCVPEPWSCRGGSSHSSSHGVGCVLGSIRMILGDSRPRRGFMRRRETKLEAVYLSYLGCTRIEGSRHFTEINTLAPRGSLLCARRGGRGTGLSCDPNTKATHLLVALCTSPCLLHIQSHGGAVKSETHFWNQGRRFASTKRPEGETSNDGTNFRGEVFFSSSPNLTWSECQFSGARARCGLVNLVAPKDRPALHCQRKAS
ncbi:hypothetical protein K402DRAFT_164805 [Aulographum hederae CBS 113979]|uniref:Uncharacterized protein n=1 Tax=Aulographum hederae CBS 113979 TaxID=1176131 RepID=A0A6G1GS60_9PEZI|nr:hypothetical protein K402DRAFT_164805 [Aulographum hederae CBS 113979]